MINHEMFHTASSFNQDLNDWNTSNVQEIESLFLQAFSFNGNVGNWDTSNVTNMGNVFNNAYSFDQDLSAWDISNVNNFQNFFWGTSLSTANYDALLIGWAAQPVQSGMTFRAPNAQYSPAAAAAARQSLIDDHGWTITDGGPE